MPIFIKTEIIKKKPTINKNSLKKIIDEHKLWIKKVKKKGINVKSGFLVNKIKKPGAGGLLILEAKTYDDALEIIKDDPMIKNKVVAWKLSEWIDIAPSNSLI